ncbi:MAG: hypothetical protein K9J21_07045 [Bacteroidales bacterium]|nr:hypothetical protein [Bacteroidales bacterium]
MKKSATKAIKEKMRNDARNLYLTVDKAGKQQYSVNEISIKLQQMYNCKIHRSTVSRWAEKENWNKQFQEMKQLGVEHATSSRKDQEILDRKAQDISNIYQIARGLNIEASDKLLKRLKEGDADDKELLNILKHSTNVIIELNDANKADESENNQKTLKVGFGNTDE